MATAYPEFEYSCGHNAPIFLSDKEYKRHLRGKKMEGRRYFKAEDNSDFMALAEELGATYVEDGESAIFMFDGNYTKRGDEGYKLGVRLDKDGELFIGEIRKSCENFEDLDSSTSLNRAEVLWLANMMEELAPHTKKK